MDPTTALVTAFFVALAGYLIWLKFHHHEDSPLLDAVDRDPIDEMEWWENVKLGHERVGNEEKSA